MTRRTTNFRELLSAGWIFGLAGLLGCLVGEGIYELFVPSLPGVARSEVCLLIDCSGSMDEKPSGTRTKLEEVKKAAKKFVEQNSSNSQIAVVGFGSGVHVSSELSSDPAALYRAIDGLNDGGGTVMHLAIQAAAARFSDTPGSRRFIFLFTDGVPEWWPDPAFKSQEEMRKEAKNLALRAAQEATSRGIVIKAVGTGDADISFLSTLSGSEAIPAYSGKFDAAFDQVAQSIFQTTGTTASSTRRVLQSGLWAALLSLGIGLALVLAQNYQLRRRPLLSVRDAWLGIPGSLVAGFSAGAIGELLFARMALASGSESLIGNLVERVASWGLLGALLGLGMAFFVPNLKAARAAGGGAMGGAVAAIVFVLLAPGIGYMFSAQTVGDLVGRLLGAAILGWFIGVMVALVDALFREAWLEVRYGPNEVRTFGLGREFLSIGSDHRACSIFAPKAPPVAFRYKMEAGRILCKDESSGVSLAILPGDERRVGTATVTVCVPTKLGEGSVDEATASPFLHLSNGRRISLRRGLQVSVGDLPGLEPESPGGVVAEVTPHPQDPSRLGLKNLSSQPWNATTANGENRQVPPGKTISATRGIKIDFGRIQGEITA